MLDDSVVDREYSILSGKELKQGGCDATVGGILEKCSMQDSPLCSSL